MANEKNMNTTEGTEKKGSFIQENAKSLTFIGGGVVVLILLYFGYQQFYLSPRAITAAEQIYKAQQYATIDSLQRRAIDGDGSFPGFKEISEEYNNTKSANIANAYLGGLYLRQGQFEDAIKSLEKYSDTGSEILDPLVTGMIGDAYSELQDYKKAASYYKKAADKSANSFTTPLMLKKLGLVAEAQQDYAQALNAYKRIKADFPDSQEATTIEAYIARVEVKN
jgi:tetratricopeptide (TPR) repeat protein